MSLSSNPTIQEVYTHILLSLRKQGKASISDTLPHSTKLTSCAYRGESGAKCAVGHCISDEDYSSEMESQGVYTLSARGYLDEGNLGWMADPEMMHFLAKMQSLHDITLRDEGIEMWEFFMKNAAFTFNLVYTEPNLVTQ